MINVNKWITYILSFFIPTIKTDIPKFENNFRLDEKIFIRIITKREF